MTTELTVAQEAEEALRRVAYSKGYVERNQTTNATAPSLSSA